MIYIHNECPVTTPADKDRNKAREEYTKHGSCGVGFGSTIQREEDYYALRFIDIFYPTILHERLKNISMYYHDRSRPYPDMTEFLEACAAIRKTLQIFRTQDDLTPASGCMFGVHDLIFEGM